MKAKWLLEEDVFQENLDGIKQAIISQGMEYKMLKYIPFEGTVFDQYNPNREDCVIGYGSLGMTQQLLRKTRWVPGAWCNLKHFECKHYYAYLGQYLLNSEYIMLPYGELLRQKYMLFSMLGMHNTLFIRPSSGFKTFTGKVVHRDDYEKEVEYFGFYDVTPEELVVVAKPRAIQGEWRVVVVNGKPVAASMYKWGGKPKVEAGCPTDVWEYAAEVAKIWQPERCFVIDVCNVHFHSFRTLRVVEINSFSSSGLYACDKNAVVEAVSAAAVEEYEEYRVTKI